MKYRDFGEHLIIDLYGNTNLTDPVHIEKSIRDIVRAINSTLLKVFLHHFGENSGVTGVAILAESHISIHTWPEYNFAALDIFACGNVTIDNALPIIQEYFFPARIETKKLTRGIPLS